MFLKACGITRLEDARAARLAGFDAIGLVFAPSPRQVNPERARALSLACPPGLLKVGVFVDEDRREVERLAEYCLLDLLQFHGSEEPSYVACFGKRAIKALAVLPDFSPAVLDEYRGCFAVLLDSRGAAHPEGPGKPPHWAAAALASLRHRVILAGGLTPTLAGRAVLRVRPFGLDVSSGVESEPGVKDHVMLTAFARAARSARPVSEVV